MSGLTEYLRLAACFHQDIAKECDGEPKKCIEEALRLYRARDASSGSSLARIRGETLASFIDQLLAQSNEEEMRSIWHDAGGVYFLFDGRFSEFLKMVRTELS